TAVDTTTTSTVSESTASLEFVTLLNSEILTESVNTVDSSILAAIGTASVTPASISSLENTVASDNSIATDATDIVDQFSVTVTNSTFNSTTTSTTLESTTISDITIMSESVVTETLTSSEDSTNTLPDQILFKFVTDLDITATWNSETNSDINTITTPEVTSKLDSTTTTTSEISVILNYSTDKEETSTTTNLITVTDMEGTTVYDLSKTTKIRPLGDVLHIFILLILSKLLKTFALFITYDLLKSFHVILILFLITFIASIFLLFIQKPFSSFRLNKIIIFRLIKYTICLTIIRLLWLFGLTLCGPLRTILLFEHSDIVILACFHVLFSSSSNLGQQQQEKTSRIRGVVFFILAILGIFAFDNDDARQRILDHPEGHTRHRLIAHMFYRLTSLIGVADHKGGVILLL
ncbi:unnamed protein product, partial [Adineta steineri]